MNAVHALEGPRLLVVGAAPHSLGATVAQVAREGLWTFDQVVTAGITPPPESVAVTSRPVYEDYKLDIRNSASMREVLHDVCPDVIVCTVGVNVLCHIETAGLRMVLEEAFHVNVIGVMELLRHFITAEGSGYWTQGRRSSKKFVVVSSNSARVARTGSLAYCASKAALSMAVRCAARELAGTAVQVWGYEPGLLAGTPMTHAVHAGLPAATALHRMRGVPPEGLPVRSVAQQIINDVAQYAPGLNGVMIPCDAGEQ